MKDAALLVGVLIILGGVSWFLYNSTYTVEAPVNAVGTGADEAVVSDFASCVEVGNPVMESYPRQCRHEGVTYTEEVSYPNEPVACTLEAKICPDGSAVGRVGPNCEFAPCPSETSSSKEINFCSPEAKTNQICTREYAPVCGLVDVQCIAAPCDPIPQTFSNACVACGQGNVDSYTEGVCLSE